MQTDCRSSKHRRLNMPDVDKQNMKIDMEKVEKEMRSISSAALYNNLKWWANGEHDVHEETLKKALGILDDIIFCKFKDDFLIKLSAGEIFYRARTINIDDYGNVEKGIHYSSDRLFGYNWKESKEPPVKYAAAGRNSQAKEKALYLASNEITACVEVRPPIRALVSIAKFVLNKDITIIDFSKLDYQNPLEKMDKIYNIDTIKYLSSVLALFSVPVYSKEEYTITQKLVKYFREKGYQGFKYRSFYADGCNYTFFDESVKEFTWESSRVVLNYATSNLFISLDRKDEPIDIENTKNVEQNVRQEIRKKIWDDVCRGWKLKFPSDKERIACDMLEILKKGENITQKELAQKRNTTVYKVQAVQRKLKAIGVIKYIGRGRNGYWKLADSTPL